MTRHSLNFWIALALTTLTAGALALGCQPGGFGGYEPCERGDDDCECDLSEEEDPMSESCSLVTDDEFGWAWDDDDDPTVDDGTTPDGDDEEPLSYRYVLIEDLTPRVAGDAPGADIDAIAIEKDGLEYYATGVVDYNIGMGGNAYVDPNQALGAPDSECEKKNFVSLGGLDDDGYLMVEFGDSSRDVTIESGDRIVVYELGSAVCPDQPNWDNDPTRVSISVSDERSSFEELFVSGDGQNVAAVP